MAAGQPIADRTGLAYKVGFGVILMGVLVISLSRLLGGPTTAIVTGLLTLLGAPVERQFLPPNQPSVGETLIQFYGAGVLVCGACIVGLRLLGGLIGLAGKSEFSARLGWDYKLGIAATAFGFSVAAASWYCQVLLYEMFLFEYGAGTVMSALATAAWGGGAVLLAGVVFLIPRLRKRGKGRPPGRTLGLGWSGLGHGWLNRLGFGMIALSVVGTMLGLGSLTIMILLAGIGILATGALMHLFAGGGWP